MAVIQTIRTKYAKLTTVIIVIALLGFILMDFGKNGGSRSTTIGKINGSEIDYTEYDAAIQAREAEIKQQNPNMTLNDQQQAQLRDQVWDQMVSSQLLNDINEKLGLVVSKQELNDLLTGPNPDPMVREAFTDRQTGQFNPQEVSANIQRLRKDPKMKDQWAAFESGLEKRRYTEKFNAMVKGGIYVPKFVLQAQLNDQSELANVNYVKLPYTLIPDDQAKVTDAEIKAYMEKHAKVFQVNEDSRSIEYVAYKIVPSAEDSAIVLKSLEDLKSDFTNTTDVETFINRTENPIPPNYYTNEQLSGLPNAEEIKNAGINTVVGPFFDGQSFVLARVLGRNSFPDSVKARHILVQTIVNGQTVLSDSAAKMRIDSAIAFIHSGVPFDSVVQRYSDDAGSKATAGEYEFTLPQKGQISKEFGDFIFEGSTGNTKTVKVHNDNYSGYHYVEILKQSAPISVTKLAFVSKSLSPTKNTYDNLYSKATQFSAKVNNKEDFDKAAQESGVATAVVNGINQNSFLLNGLGSSRDLVKWVYDAKVGDVSSIYTVGENYVVAKVKDIQKKGLVNITDETRPILSGYVMKEKKAKLLMDKYKGTSLNSIAQAANETVVAADSVKFQSGIPGLEGEGRVTGYALYKEFKENTTSPAIQGNDGVYYLSVLNRIKLAVNPQQNLSNERLILENNLKNSAAQMIINGIKENADVKDQRAKIY